MPEFLQLISREIAINSTTIGEFFGVEVTNTMASGMLLTCIIIFIAVWVSRFKLRDPGKLQLAFETVIESTSQFISQIAGTARMGNIVPSMVSFVIVILLANIMNVVLPFLDSLSIGENPLFRTYTADFNTTLVLALLGVGLTQLVAIKHRGIFGHIGQYIKIIPLLASFFKGPKAVFHATIEFAIGLLDIISEFARVISLSLRLFGNLYAGVVLIGVFASFFALFLPIPVILLSTLAGIVQALVFGALITSYVSTVAPEEAQDIDDPRSEKTLQF